MIDSNLICLVCFEDIQPGLSHQPTYENERFVGIPKTVMMINEMNKSRKLMKYLNRKVCTTGSNDIAMARGSSVGVKKGRQCFVSDKYVIVIVKVREKQQRGCEHVHPKYFSLEAAHWH